eukprot:9306886-Pyramimonas_sp.AAC.2
MELPRLNISNIIRMRPREAPESAIRRPKPNRVDQIGKRDWLGKIPPQVVMRRMRPRRSVRLTRIPPF